MEKQELVDYFANYVRTKQFTAPIGSSLDQARKRDLAHLTKIADVAEVKGVLSQFNVSIASVICDAYYSAVHKA